MVMACPRFMRMRTSCHPLSVTFDREADAKIYECTIHNMHITFTCSVVNTSCMFFAHALFLLCITLTMDDYRPTTTTHSENNSECARNEAHFGPNDCGLLNEMNVDQRPPLGPRKIPTVFGVWHSKLDSTHNSFQTLRRGKICCALCDNQ